MKNETTRRQFCKSALAATPLVMLSNASAQSQPTGLSKKLGIALVGLGYYSKDLLAPALQMTKNCYLAGIVSFPMDDQQYWIDKYNIPRKNIYAHTDFDAIADNPDIDIIYVVLPNSMHHEYTIRAAKAGKHVICEKPMALTVKECQEMIDACNDNHVRLSIGYRLHYEPYTQEVMRYGRDKVFGAIKYVHASAGYRNRSKKSHWKLQKAYGGGALMDMGVYCIQGARYTIQEEPVSVTAQQFTFDPERYDEVDEMVTMQFEFPGGAVANLTTTFAASTNTLYAAAEKKWFSMNPFSLYNGLTLRTQDGPVNLPDINQQAAQMDDVAWSIAKKLPMRVPGKEGLQDIKIVTAVKKAIKTGNKVEIL